MNETLKLPPESVEGNTHLAEVNDKVYDVYKLIELAKTIESHAVPTSTFDNNKEGKYWHAKDGSADIGPSDIIDALEGVVDWDGLTTKHPEWQEHIEKIRHADYETYPILYTGTDLVVDGMHRLTKAWIDRAPEIKAKLIENLPDSAVYIEQKVGI